MATEVKLLIIDGFNLFRRIFSAIPEHSDPTKHQSGFINSCVQSVQRALHQHRPTHAVIVLDGEGQTWRHKQFPDYKKNRKPQPLTLLRALPDLMLALNSLGLDCIESPETEADDVIATLVHKLQQHKINITILSTDYLLAQLLSDRVTQYDHFKDQPIDSETINQRFGIEPNRLSEYYALVGSSSLNIPGVHGVGPKGAKTLLALCDNLSQLQNLSETIPKTLNNKLNEQYDNVGLFCELFTLHCNINFHGNLAEWRLPNR